MNHTDHAHSLLGGSILKSHANRTHAILSPSFLHIALNCPGSVGLKEKIPEPPKSEAARLGTLTHEKAELYLKAHLEERLTGKLLPFTTESVPKRVIEATEGWRDAVWRYMFEESITGKAWGLEDRLTYSEKFSNWGTADAWVAGTDERAKRYVHIADLKTGHIVVDIKTPQLPNYALAFRQELRNKGKDIDYAICSIYSPFAEGDKWRSIKYTNKQLDTFEKKILKLAEEVFSGKAKFKAGDHCKYCPCQAHCETYGKYISKETSLALIDPTELKFPDINIIPPEVLTKIVLNLKALEQFGKACKRRVLESLSLGEKWPGIKAVEGKARRKIDEEKADKLEKFCSKFGVSPYNQKLKGIGELESLVSPMLGAKNAKSQIDSFTIKNPAPIILVPESDGREAVLSKIELLNDIEIEE